MPLILAGTELQRHMLTIKRTNAPRRLLRAAVTLTPAAIVWMLCVHPALAQSASPRDPNIPINPATAAPRTGAPWQDNPAEPLQQDPRALEILKSGIKALGGEQAFLGRTTIYVRRKVTNHESPEPREGTVTLWFKRPNKIRKEISYPPEKHVEAFDGSRAWFDSGSGAQMRGPALTASIVDGMSELDMPANYIDADLTYFNISQEIPGKVAHVVKVRKNGYTKELMFDVTSFLLHVVGVYENPWGATDKMIKYDRYRPVDGLMVPYREERWRANEMSMESEILEIRFNGPIDDALFAVPAGASAPQPPGPKPGP